MVRRPIRIRRKTKDQNLTERVEANRLIAFFMTSRGDIWVGINDNLRILATELKVEIDGRRRSEVAIECAARLRSQGVSVPGAYMTPWQSRGER